MTVLDSTPVALTRRRCAVAGGKVYLPCHHCGAALSVAEAGARHAGGARVKCAKCSRWFYMELAPVQPGPAVAAAGREPATRPGGNAVTRAPASAWVYDLFAGVE